MEERTRALIDSAALQHNFNVVKSFAPQQAVLAMVKANGYGHGLVHVAKTLTQADALGVANIEEALILRANEITQRIVLMSGITSLEELILAAAEQLEIVLHHESQIEILRQATFKNPITVWLKIDTGMHRLGFAPEKISAIYHSLMQNNQIKKPIYLLTHLADADDLDKQTTQQQVKLFKKVTEKLIGPKSVANSAGIIAFPETYMDWVRPGLMLYGASPLHIANEVQNKLKPVMTLQAKIIAINRFARGAAIGYGGTWCCPEDMLVGVVAIGYGDGYPRYAKNGTPVLINNIRCPLVGRVSMDMLSVDLRDCPQARIGDVATLWGKNLPAEEIAVCADTIPYTLFCGVTQRVKYIIETPAQKN